MNKFIEIIKKIFEYFKHSYVDEIITFFLILFLVLNVISNKKLNGGWDDLKQAQKEFNETLVTLDEMNDTIQEQTIIEEEKLEAVNIKIDELKKSSEERAKEAATFFPAWKWEFNNDEE
jgi:hypothetical protein